MLIIMLMLILLMLLLMLIVMMLMSDDANAADWQLSIVNRRLTPSPGTPLTIKGLEGWW